MNVQSNEDALVPEAIAFEGREVDAFMSVLFYMPYLISCIMHVYGGWKHTRFYVHHEEVQKIPVVNWEEPVDSTSNTARLVQNGYST